MAAHEGSLAQRVDQLAARGFTFEEIAARSAPEADRRGLTVLRTPGQIRAHVKYRADQGKTFSGFTPEAAWRMLRESA